jgi:hypothetical protein
MGSARNPTHVVTLRLSSQEHEALRAFASYAGLSMNEVLLRALRVFLTSQAAEAEVDRIVEEGRAAFRHALDELVERSARDE